MSKLRWAGVILVWLALLFSANFLIFEIRAEGIVTIGYAIKDITPNIAGFPEPKIYLPGNPYNKPASSMQSNLSIRAIVIDNEAERIALVVCDCFGLFRVDVERIREKVKDIFPKSGRVIVASTHTHSAPDTTGVYSDARIEPDMLRYIDLVVERGAEAIREAYAQKRHARFNVSRLRIHDLIRNDRHPEFVDNNFFMLHASPLGAYHDTGDPFSNLLENFATTFYGDKIQPIVMFNFACHPEFLRKTQTISADFVGDLRERMELIVRGLDGKVSRSLFFNGALGGMVVADTPKRQNESSSMVLFNDEFIKRVRESRIVFQNTDLSPIRFYSGTFKIKLDNDLFRDRVSRNLMPQKLEGDRLVVETSVTQLGRHVILVAVPGELSPEISLKIRKLFPRKYVAILGLANDELGYILPKNRYKEKIHEYERHFAVNDEIGERIFDEIKKLSAKTGGGMP
ncbi:MAG: hypothetical protein Q8Q06_02625 [bacterium]|nr:hypothetical protein [bacterium]